MSFERIGTMVDCSRNAVMNIKTVKRWIDLTGNLGFNTLMLYTEDTYEIKDEPYFGYLRGRYSFEELKEIDSYANKKGMELIPCIQTLAHLNAIFRWPKYSEINDYNDILLVGDERTYQLIEKMFKSVSECFTSKTVHIGMDEALMLGLGKYLDKNGFENRSDILLKHLKKVSEIAEKYDFNLLMWGDMFDFLAKKGFPIEDIKAKIPKNIELVYWDYYSKNEKNYIDKLDSYQAISKDTWFAGGLWTWNRFAPSNRLAFVNSKAAVSACLKKDVKNIFFTLWGDDGAECSRFSALPALFSVSEFVKGNFEIKDIKKKFKNTFKIDFDDFMLADLPNTPNKDMEFTNYEKLVFYNDGLLGLYDSTVPFHNPKDYKKEAKRLNKLCTKTEYGYIFETLKRYCQVLEVKFDFGCRLRKAYQENDKKELNKLCNTCDEIIKRLEAFYNAFEKQWHIENKPQGFDIIDFRIGGLIMRFKTAKRRITQFLNGDIEKIEELEEKILDIYGNGENFKKGDIRPRHWSDAATVSVIQHIFK